MTYSEAKALQAGDVVSVMLPNGKKTAAIVDWICPTGSAVEVWGRVLAGRKVGRLIVSADYIVRLYE